MKDQKCYNTGCPIQGRCGTADDLFCRFPGDNDSCPDKIRVDPDEPEELTRRIIKQDNGCLMVEMLDADVPDRSGTYLVPLHKVMGAGIHGLTFVGFRFKNELGLGNEVCDEVCDFITIARANGNWYHAKEAVFRRMEA